MPTVAQLETDQRMLVDIFESAGVSGVSFRAMRREWKPDDTGLFVNALTLDPERLITVNQLCSVGNAFFKRAEESRHSNGGAVVHPFGQGGLRMIYPDGALGVNLQELNSVRVQVVFIYDEPGIFR